LNQFIAICADINEVKTQICSDINEVKTTMYADINEVKTAICADINKVKTTESQVSAKQEDEPSPLPPSSSDLTPYDFHLFSPVEDELRGRLLANETIPSTACCHPAATSSTRPAYCVSSKDGRTVLMMKKTS
jgi:hypothetical protein